jgi:hypothetical protein
VISHTVPQPSGQLPETEGQRNEYVAHEGKSALNGLPVKQLDAVLPKALNDHN